MGKIIADFSKEYSGENRHWPEDQPQNNPFCPHEAKKAGGGKDEPFCHTSNWQSEFLKFQRGIDKTGALPNNIGK
jgi:hypothetical protein